ncbi:MAG: pilin [bacterium]|nr:pilin [bacterium]
MKSYFAVSLLLVGLAIAIPVFAGVQTANAQGSCGGVGQRCCQPAEAPHQCITALVCSNFTSPICETGICACRGVAPPPPNPSTITLINPLSGTSDVRGLIERFVTILRDFATPIAVLMILFGAFRILTAAGDPAKFETGKKILLYTAIGYAIIFVGWGITSIIESLLSS